MHFPKLFQNYRNIWVPKGPYNDTFDTDLVDQAIEIIHKVTDISNFNLYSVVVFRVELMSYETLRI